MRIKSLSIKWLDKSWLRNQVENHLFFQYFAKYIPFGLVIILLVTVNIVYSLIDFEKSVTFIIYDNIFPLLIAVFLLTIPKLHQAIIGWIALKFTIGITAILLMTVGTILSYTEGRNDVIPNFLLGIIWIPLLEFIPGITSKQKYVTLARILLSIPVIYLGIDSGDWH
jgi:hypothetical protein